MSDEELLDAIAAEPMPKVDLSVVRKKAVELRGLYLEEADIKERMSKVHQKITNIERKDLPDLFSNAGISSVTVDADHNHPAFVAERGTVYTAKIPDDNRTKALEWF